MGRVVETLVGGGVRETVEVFRENAEAAAGRTAEARAQSLDQFAAEFAKPQRSGFDALVDGLNRLPRPIMAFGCLGLIASAMVAPEWFAARMMGLALVPEPLWWLMGAIVSFYFGARHQAKGQAFRRDALVAAARMASATAPAPTGNAALDDWRAGHGE